jgi:hypothetical protein
MLTSDLDNDNDNAKMDGKTSVSLGVDLSGSGGRLDVNASRVRVVISRVRPRRTGSHF